AADRLTEAEAIADRLDDPTLRVRTAFQFSALRTSHEEVDEVRRGLAIADSVGDPGLQVEGYIRLVGALYNVGDLAEAEKQLSHCADLVHEFGSLRDEARLTFQLGLVKYHLGELEEAEASGLQAQAWLDRTGERYIQLQNLRTLALC